MFFVGLKSRVFLFFSFELFTFFAFLFATFGLFVTLFPSLVLGVSDTVSCLY